ncbi:hypothetical protein R3P38DRAFT_2568245, partial [Favolaschia claudopus]
VSGSTSLPVLLDMKFKPNDLDVYTFEPDEDRLLNLVKNSFGFAIVHQTNNPYWQDMHGIKRTHWLRKNTHIINIIVMPADSAAGAIFQFHSTIVMNYISGWGVFCAYPDLTLRGKSVANHSALATEGQRNRAKTCFVKYGERGIDHQARLSDHKDWSSHVCGVDPSCPITLRALHDRASLFIPFKSVELKDGLTPVYDGMKSMVWSLGGSTCEKVGSTYHPSIAFPVEALSKVFVNYFYKRCLSQRSPCSSLRKPARTIKTLRKLTSGVLVTTSL